MSNSTHLQISFSHPQTAGSYAAIATVKPNIGEAVFPILPALWTVEPQPDPSLSSGQQS